MRLLSLKSSGDLTFIHQHRSLLFSETVFPCPNPSSSIIVSMIFIHPLHLLPSSIITTFYFCIVFPCDCEGLAFEANNDCISTVTHLQCVGPNHSYEVKFGHIRIQ